jgi:hypothetical protein
MKLDRSNAPSTMARDRYPWIGTVPGPAARNAALLKRL